MLNTNTFGQGPNLTLLHGWGAHNAVWQAWAQASLAQSFTITLVELPGFGHSPSLADSAQIETDWLNAIEAVLPPKTHLLGWSLGGLLAQKLAYRNPKQIDKLICLASTPRFTQADHWPQAVPPKLMADFVKAVSVDALSTLKRFWKLQLQGSENVKPLMRQLILQMKDSRLPSLQGLLQGLHLLNALDCRADTLTLKQPTLWLLGEKDPLIPHTSIQHYVHPVDLTETSAFTPKNSTITATVPIQYHPNKVTVEVIQGASHMPFWSHPTETAHVILRFLQPKTGDLLTVNQ